VLLPCKVTERQEGMAAATPRLIGIHVDNIVPDTSRRFDDLEITA
jgi:hypothetical protein